MIAADRVRSSAIAIADDRRNRTKSAKIMNITTFDS